MSSYDWEDQDEFCIEMCVGVLFLLAVVAVIAFVFVTTIGILFVVIG